jgi:hypothetical protein
VEPDDFANLLSHLHQFHILILTKQSDACVVVLEVRKEREDLRPQGPLEGKLAEADGLLD